MTEVSAALATVTCGTGERRHQGSPLTHSLARRHKALSETLWPSVTDLSQKAVTHMGGSVWNIQTSPACLLCAHSHTSMSQCLHKTGMFDLPGFKLLALASDIFSVFSFKPGVSFNGSHSIFQDLLRLSTDESSWHIYISIQFWDLTCGNLSHYFCLHTVQTLTKSIMIQAFPVVCCVSQRFLFSWCSKSLQFPSSESLG